MRPPRLVADGADDGGRQDAGHQQHHQQLGLDADPGQHPAAKTPGVSAQAWMALGYLCHVDVVIESRRLACKTCGSEMNVGKSYVMNQPDPFDLQRFVDAQARVYDTCSANCATAASEAIGCGSCFRNCAGLGSSPTAVRYRDLVDRRGPRLPRPRRARPAPAGMRRAGRRDRRPLGRGDLRLARRHEVAVVDDAVRRAPPTTTRDFVAVLEKFYGGEEDSATLARLS